MLIGYAAIAPTNLVLQMSFAGQRHERLMRLWHQLVFRQVYW